MRLRWPVEGRRLLPESISVTTTRGLGLLEAADRSELRMASLRIKFAPGMSTVWLNLRTNLSYTIYAFWVSHIWIFYLSYILLLLECFWPLFGKLGHFQHLWLWTNLLEQIIWVGSFRFYLPMSASVCNRTARDSGLRNSFLSKPAIVWRCNQ